MAVNVIKSQTSINLKYKEGVDLNGKDIIKSQRFSKIKVDAADDSIYAVAKAIETVMSYAVVDVVKEDNSLITNA